MVFVHIIVCLVKLGEDIQYHNGKAGNHQCKVNGPDAVLNPVAPDFYRQPAVKGIDHGMVGIAGKIQCQNETKRQQTMVGMIEQFKYGSGQCLAAGFWQHHTDFLDKPCFQTFYRKCGNGGKQKDENGKQGQKKVERQTGRPQVQVFLEQTTKEILAYVINTVFVETSQGMRFEVTDKTGIRFGYRSFCNGFYCRLASVFSVYFIQMRLLC